MSNNNYQSAGSVSGGHYLDSQGTGILNYGHPEQGLLPAQVETADLIQDGPSHFAVAGEGKSPPRATHDLHCNHDVAAAGTSSNEFPGSATTPMSKSSLEDGGHNLRDPAVADTSSLSKKIEKEERELVSVKPFPKGFKSKTWQLVLPIDLEKTRKSWETFLNERGGMEYLRELEKQIQNETKIVTDANKKRKRRGRRSKSFYEENDVSENGDDEEDEGEHQQYSTSGKKNRINKPFGAIQMILKENDPTFTGSDVCIGKIVLCKICYEQKSTCSLTDCMIRCSLNLSNKSRQPMIGNIVKHFETSKRSSLTHKEMWLRQQPNPKVRTSLQGASKPKKQQNSFSSGQFVSEGKKNSSSCKATDKTGGRTATTDGFSGGALLSSTIKTSMGAGDSTAVVLGGNTRRSWWHNGTGKLRGSMGQLRERLRFAYSWDDNLVARAMEGYRQFMLLKVALGDFNDTILAPSPIIDQVWQQHVLDMFHYEDDCDVLCGKISNCSDVDENDQQSCIIVRNPDRQRMDMHSYAEARRVTQLTLQAKFVRNQIDSEIWFLSSEKHISLPLNSKMQVRRGRRTRRKESYYAPPSLSNTNKVGQQQRQVGQHDQHPDEEEDSSDDNDLDGDYEEEEDLGPVRMV